MQTLDAELVTALKAAKTKPMFFALVAKGTDGKLLVAKTKIPAKEIAEAKKECGGGTVYQGKCHSEDNGNALVFEVPKEAPGAVAATAKKIIKEHTGLVYKSVEFRVNAELESETEEGQGEQSGSPSRSSAPSKAPPPVPPAAPTKAKPVVDADAFRFGERLKSLAPALQQALATGKPQAEAAKQKIADANALFRNHDYTQANTALDQAEPLIKQALAETAKPAAPAGDAAAWKQQYAALEPRYLEALKGDAATAAKLRTLMGFATGKAEAGAYAKAVAALKQLEPLLKPAAPKDAAKPQANDAFFTEWKAARTELQLAINKVAAQLNRFAAAILDTNEENLVWVAEEGLGRLLTSLREDATAIDRSTSKTPAKVAAKAKPLLEGLRQQLKSAQVRACDENKLDVSVTINSTIGGAIKSLEAALALAK